MIARQRWVKAALWLIVGFLVVMTAARFKSGLGSTTNLTDVSPWGLWIAFDVMAGVALAAGGFVLAATVHIFHLEKYHRFVRPAILTALLGYIAVAVGLLYDLGLPWHIWHPMVFPQPHSVLFEVAMCVMLYLTVLLLEFSPVVLEHPLLDRPLFRTIRNLLTRFTIPLVIAGIVLSTLHQSSLGSLFLIAPYRLHALWYSPIIWVLFFVSAIGLGLMTVTLESYFSSWLFGHKLRSDLLAGLGKAGAVVLGVYVVLRLGDLAIRGELGGAFDGSTMGNLFLFELAVAGVIPAILFAIPKVRNHPQAMGWTALLALLGIVGYRFNVCLVAFARPESMPYFPSWMEFSVSIGIVAAATLVFITFVEHFKVYPPEDEHDEEHAAEAKPSFSPHGFRLFLPESLAAPRRYSLAALIGASLAMAFLPTEALHGPQPFLTPVSASQAITGAMLETDADFGHEFFLAGPERDAAIEDDLVTFTILDGNRDGRLVLFAHDRHTAMLGGDASCNLCHHQNLPFAQQSECTSCHRDMYTVTDTFDHSSHLTHFGGNDGCVRCHEGVSGFKTRENATSCGECHEGMVVLGSRIEPAESGLGGYAVGFMDAMHGLCIGCHEERVAEQPERYPVTFAECATCHRDAGGDDLRALGPYRTRPDTSATEDE